MRKSLDTFFLIGLGFEGSALRCPVWGGNQSSWLMRANIHVFFLVIGVLKPSLCPAGSLEVYFLGRILEYNSLTQRNKTYFQLNTHYYQVLKSPTADQFCFHLPYLYPPDKDTDMAGIHQPIYQYGLLRRMEKCSLLLTPDNRAKFVFKPSV